MDQSEEITNLKHQVQDRDCTIAELEEKLLLMAKKKIQAGSRVKTKLGEGVIVGFLRDQQKAIVDLGRNEDGFVKIVHAFSINDIETL
jgi:hypothetical protein